MLDLLKDHNLGLFKHGWYVDMDELDNLYPDLYLLFLDEEGVSSWARILTSADPNFDDLLHVQVEVIEGDTCFLLYIDLKVCKSQPNLMKVVPIHIWSIC